MEVCVFSNKQTGHIDVRWTSPAIGKPQWFDGFVENGQWSKLLVPADEIRKPRSRLAKTCGAQENAPLPR
jgi:hypothetical protein